MQSIFISHSSKNAWVVGRLIELIKRVDAEAMVFCSSEASIKPGANYKEAIFESLRGSDLFVAVISNEYWESRYCILELGAAYERFCFDVDKPVSIQPMLVPPLDKGMALANTPLVELQLTDLIDPRSILLFLDKVAGLGGCTLEDGLELRAAEFAAYVHRGVLEGTSLLDEAEAGAYFDERPENSTPREQIVSCKRLGDLEDERVQFEFNLSRLPYKPSFASVALRYWDGLNLREYLAFDRDAALCIEIQNDDGVLDTLTVELKYGDNQIFQAVERELAEGANEVRIPLGRMNHKPLGEISQICMVVHPERMKGLDGRVILSNLRVDFKQRNILVEE